MTESTLPNANNDRLDRIERIVESLATGQVQINHTVNDLSQIQLRMMEELAEYRRSMLEMRADILEMQSEVRGLQTENRRILDRLFNEN